MWLVYWAAPVPPSAGRLRFNNTVSLGQLYKRPFKNYSSLDTSSEPATSFFSFYHNFITEGQLFLQKDWNP